MLLLQGSLGLQSRVLPACSCEVSCAFRLCLEPKVDGGRHEVAKYLVEKKAETNWLAEPSETQQLYWGSVSTA